MKLPELNTWQSILLGIVAGAAVLAAVISVTLPDRMTPLRILPTMTMPPFQVYVSGAVKIPGVVVLPAGSRVQNAISEAGGVTDNADLQQLNLAAVVNDGQKIVVPGFNENIPASTTDAISDSAVNDLQINLNQASQKEFEALPGIGEEKAKAIILERQKRGKFSSIDDLIEIPGITQNIINQIRPYIVIN
jgi:competence protein ComEA